jgi:hypothetical protein
MTHPHKTASWEKEFDKRWNFGGKFQNAEALPHVKQFIHRILAKRMREVGEVMAEADKWDENFINHKRHNKVIADILTKLKGLENNSKQATVEI